ncbi:hypothetical protein HDU76_010962, partial [Blyttiomyces sp. JEL0837]
CHHSPSKRDFTRLKTLETNQEEPIHIRMQACYTLIEIVMTHGDFESARKACRRLLDLFVDVGQYHHKYLEGKTAYMHAQNLFSTIYDNSEASNNITIDLPTNDNTIQITVYDQLRLWKVAAQRSLERITGAIVLSAIDDEDLEKVPPGTPHEMQFTIARITGVIEIPVVTILFHPNLNPNKSSRKERAIANLKARISLLPPVWTGVCGYCLTTDGSKFYDVKLSNAGNGMGLNDQNLQSNENEQFKSEDGTKIALKHCKKCKKVAYCSVKCQQLHWTEGRPRGMTVKHKKACRTPNEYKIGDLVTISTFDYVDQIRALIAPYMISLKPVRNDVCVVEVCEEDFGKYDDSLVGGRRWYVRAIGGETMMSVHESYMDLKMSVEDVE